MEFGLGWGYVRNFLKFLFGFHLLIRFPGPEGNYYLFIFLVEKKVIFLGMEGNSFFIKEVTEYSLLIKE